MISAHILILLKVNKDQLTFQLTDPTELSFTENWLAQSPLTYRLLCVQAGLNFKWTISNPLFYVFLLAYFKVYKVTYANRPKQGL